MWVNVVAGSILRVCTGGVAGVYCGCIMGVLGVH